MSRFISFRRYNKKSHRIYNIDDTYNKDSQQLSVCQMMKDCAEMLKPTHLIPTPVATLLAFM